MSENEIQRILDAIDDMRKENAALLNEIHKINVKCIEREDTYLRGKVLLQKPPTTAEVSAQLWVGRITIAFLSIIVYRIIERLL